MKSITNMTFQFTWKIENYSLCNMQTGNFITSPVFTAKLLGGSKWILYLYPNGIDSEHSEYISCGLVRYVDAPRFNKVYINYRICIGCSDCFVKSATESQSFEMNKGHVAKDFILAKLITDKMKVIGDKTLIVRCLLKMCDKPSKPASECEARTKIGAMEIPFTFIMPNDSSCPDQYTAKFSRYSEYQVSYSVSYDELLVNIVLISENILYPRLIEYQATLLDKNGRKIKSISDTHLFDCISNNNSWDFSILIVKEHLLKIKKNDSPTSEKFTLSFVVRTPDSTMKEKLSYTSYEAFSNDEIVRSLREDFQNMFLENQNWDVQLRVGEELYKANKCVLSARSPVFRSQFQNDMPENIVDITEVEPAVFQMLLEFMYCGTIEEELIPDTAMRLLILSHDYQIRSLFNKCASFLKLNLTVENACDVLSTANKVGNQSLKSIALHYIASHTETIMHFVWWIQWAEENVNLVDEIYALLAKNID